MRQQSWRQIDGRLPLVALALAVGQSPELPGLKVDVAATDGRDQCRAADRPCPRPGVEANQDEPGDVPRSVATLVDAVVASSACAMPPRSAVPPHFGSATVRARVPGHRARSDGIASARRRPCP